MCEESMQDPQQEVTRTCARGARKISSGGPCAHVRGEHAGSPQGAIRHVQGKHAGSHQTHPRTWRHAHPRLHNNSRREIREYHIASAAKKPGGLSDIATTMHLFPTPAGICRSLQGEDGHVKLYSDSTLQCGAVYDQMSPTSDQDVADTSNVGHAWVCACAGTASPLKGIGG